MEACDCLRKKYGRACLENNDTSKGINEALWERRVEVPWKGGQQRYYGYGSRQQEVELDECFKTMAASGRLTSRNLNAHFTARHKHPTNRTNVGEVAAEARAATVVRDRRRMWPATEGGATEVSSQTSASVITRSMRAGEYTRNGRAAPNDYEFIYVPWRRGYSMHSAKLHLNDLMRMREENQTEEDRYDSDDSDNSYHERYDGGGRWATAPDPDEPTLCYTDTHVDDILPAVKWMGHDCGQQLLTGSFHPLPEGEWSTDAISAPPNSATVGGGAGGEGSLTKKSSGADSEGEGKGDDGPTRERAWPVRCRVRIECFDADDELANKTLRKALYAAMPSLGPIKLDSGGRAYGAQPADAFLRNSGVRLATRWNVANSGTLPKGFVPGLVLRTAATEAEAAAMMAAASGVSGATLAVESYSMESHMCFPWLGVDTLIDGHREGNGGSGVGDDGGGDHAMPTASLAKSQASQRRQVCARCSAALLVPNRCKRCFQVSYCNRECQRKHWKRHRDQCRKDGQSAVKTPVAAGGSGEADRGDGGTGGCVGE